MPKIIVTVPESDLSVTRPVVLDITRQLMKATGISEKTNVFFPGDHERGAQPHSLISPTDESDMFPFNDRVSIEVEESYNADRILSEAVYEPEHMFVFRDDKVKASIRPVYSMADMVINIKFRAKDKTSAIRWRDDMRTRIGMKLDERYHTVKYHYLIPREFLVILEELHRMREANAGYGDSYSKYMEEHLSNRVTTITNLAGEQPELAVRETQQRIIGYFDFDGVPENGSKEDDGDTWTINVAYKFSFEKPVACTMQYPLVVHNQLLDQRFRPNEPLADPEKAKTSRTASLTAWQQFEQGTTPAAMIDGVAVPHFDEFLPESVPGRTKRLVTMMTLLDSTLPGLLVSAEEMESIGIHPIVLHFMRTEAPFMTKRYQSILQLDLYKNEKILPQTVLSIDSHLQIKSTEELSLRDGYHVRLSVVEDLRLLPKAAIDRLKHSGKAAQIILYYLAPWLLEAGLIPSIITKDILSTKELNRAIDAINAGIISIGNGQNYQFNTVGSIFVQAFSRRD